MGRILVFLTGACLIGAFIFLNNMGNKSVSNGTESNSNESKQSTSQSTKPSHSPKNNQDRASDRGSRKAVKSHQEAKGAKTEPNQTVNTASTESEGNSEVDEDASQPRVKDESAPLYSLNSKNSHVLRRLKRGEKLKTDVDVIDSEGRWSIVKGQGDTKSGFVRNENLEKSKKGVAKTKAIPNQ